jgi:2,5-diketo-D-gluconate reductase A
MEYVTLANGVKMPILGYGVYQVKADECERCVMDALEVGYRSIDTAQSYFNETETGNGIRKSGLPREEIFLTTKVWVEHYGYEEAKKSVLESMEKLQTITHIRKQLNGGRMTGNIFVTIKLSGIKRSNLER